MGRDSYVVVSGAFFRNGDFISFIFGRLEASGELEVGRYRGAGDDGMGTVTAGLLSVALGNELVDSGLIGLGIANILDDVSVVSFGVVSDLLGGSGVLGADFGAEKELAMGSGVLPTAGFGA